MSFRPFLKSKSFMLYFLIILNLLIIPYYISKAETTEVGLALAMKESGAAVEEISVNAFVNTSSKFTKPEQGVEMVLALSEKMELQNNVLENLSVDDHTEIILQGNNVENQHITIILQSSQYESFKETNIVMDVVHQGSWIDVNKIEQRLKKALKAYGSIDITVNMTAYYEGHLKKIEQEEKLNRMMLALAAQKVEGMEDESLISIVGYTPTIESWIRYGGNRVNINLAMRYNSYEDRTYLWLGTPLISIGY